LVEETGVTDKLCVYGFGKHALGPHININLYEANYI